MPDRVLQDIPFSGNTYRQRTSIAREYACLIRIIVAGDSLSEEFDARMAAGISVEIDNSMTGTHLTVYGSYSPGGAKRPLYGANGNILILTVNDGLVTLPADVFPVGFLAFRSASDANGTPQLEAAQRTYVVMMKT